VKRRQAVGTQTDVVPLKAAPRAAVPGRHRTRK
jgi:hypothetical protein